MDLALSFLGIAVAAFLFGAASAAGAYVMTRWMHRPRHVPVHPQGERGPEFFILRKDIRPIRCSPTISHQ